MLRRKHYEKIFSAEYKDKMRFIAGPRQSGKTTLAQYFLKNEGCEKLYYNWDRREVRNNYYQNTYFYYEDVLSLERNRPPWLCFDEIHKIPNWKNILKDIYDTEHDKLRFIVTGSARLDLFRKSGDSLTGRYFLFHLFPITLKELVNIKRNDSEEKPNLNALSFIENRLGTVKYHQSELQQLLHFSGYPEPLLEAKDNLHLMWQNNYIDTIVREDIRDIANVKNIENIARLAYLLPSRVGSTLSVNGLTKDIEVSYPAIRNYLNLLDLSYFIFKISPYSKNIVRSIKKEQKTYLFDWTRIQDNSKQFENYVAFELLSLVTYWKDHGYGNFGLHFIRNRDGQETDFLVTLDNQPWLLIEVKLSDDTIDNHHLRQAAALGNIPFVQVLFKNKVAKKLGPRQFVVSASRFL
jgi:uncharacterized protein